MPSYKNGRERGAKATDMHPECDVTSRKILNVGSYMSDGVLESVGLEPGSLQARACVVWLAAIRKDTGIDLQKVAEALFIDEKGCLTIEVPGLATGQHNKGSLHSWAEIEQCAKEVQVDDFFYPAAQCVLGYLQFLTRQARVGVKYITAAVHAHEKQQKSSGKSCIEERYKFRLFLLRSALHASCGDYSQAIVDLLSARKRLAEHNLLICTDIVASKAVPTQEQAREQALWRWHDDECCFLLCKCYMGQNQREKGCAVRNEALSPLKDGSLPEKSPEARFVRPRTSYAAALYGAAVDEYERGSPQALAQGREYQLRAESCEKSGKCEENMEITTMKMVLSLRKDGQRVRTSNEKATTCTSKVSTEAALYAAPYEPGEPVEIHTLSGKNAKYNGQRGLVVKQHAEIAGKVIVRLPDLKDKELGLWPKHLRRYTSKTSATAEATEDHDSLKLSPGDIVEIHSLAGDTASEYNGERAFVVGKHKQISGKFCVRLPNLDGKEIGIWPKNLTLVESKWKETSRNDGEDSTYKKCSPGNLVEIHSLSGESGKNFNGERALVIRDHHGIPGKKIVRIPNLDDKELGIWPKNLRRVSADAAEDATETSQGHAVQPPSTTFVSDDVVVIHSLSGNSGKRYNGERGFVVGPHSEIPGKLVIRMPSLGGKEIGVWPKHLRMVLAWKNVKDGLSLEECKRASVNEFFYEVDGILEPAIQCACDVQKNLTDPYGDGDQSELTCEPGGPGDMLQAYWSTSGNYNPFERSAEYSGIHRAAAHGNLKELEALLDLSLPKLTPEEERIVWGKAKSDEGGKNCEEAKSTKASGRENMTAELQEKMKTRRMLLELRESNMRATPLQGTIAGARLVCSPLALTCWPECLRTHDVDHVGCARLLLEARANADSRDVMGNTCLMLATNDMATSETMRVAHLLIEKGEADIHAVNRMKAPVPVASLLKDYDHHTIEHIKLGCDIDTVTWSMPVKSQSSRLLGNNYISTSMGSLAQKVDATKVLTLLGEWKKMKKDRAKFRDQYRNNLQKMAKREKDAVDKERNRLGPVTVEYENVKGKEERMQALRELQKVVMEKHRTGNEGTNCGMQ